MNPENPYQSQIPTPFDPAGPPAGATKPRKRLPVAALIVIAVLIVGTASYGGYQLLGSKQAPKPQNTSTAGTKPDNQSQPKKPSSTAPAHKPAAKTTSKPPVKTTQPSSTSSTGSTATKPAATHTSTPAQTKPCKNYSNSYCYQWVGGRQYITASGVSVQFGQAEPKTTGTSSTGHTLVELSVGTADGKQYVEVGWILPDSSGNKGPRLFVYHWVDGKSSCYNGCGFVQVSSSVYPGEALTVGATGTYKINYASSQWQVFYDGSEVGYFPGSLWSGKFTQAGFTQIFGEVASSTMNACTQMGNGIYGSSAGSLLISNYTLLGSTTTPYLSPYNVNNYSGSTKNYNYGAATPTSLRIGGPGPC